eukprot:gnl/TRDRNA2_/TRDRNA2_171583_c1_seq4.p1 gnl/TRDRNA2_/TRDRNA2_171583_c1~~gnl/TRDRNA2_/TRDRNA2_171583_c1_seq4.p1  ORF type:complete len:580 (+),score=105.16 gnl/TRDRNA2_/TRDRNA2_171583_c1_seq4:110-1741(+)
MKENAAPLKTSPAASPPQTSPAASPPPVPLPLGNVLAVQAESDDEHLDGQRAEAFAGLFLAPPPHHDVENIDNAGVIEQLERSGQLGGAEMYGAGDSVGESAAYVSKDSGQLEGAEMCGAGDSVGGSAPYVSEDCGAHVEKAVPPSQLDQGIEVPVEAVVNSATVANSGQPRPTVSPFLKLPQPRPTAQQQPKRKTAVHGPFGMPAAALRRRDCPPSSQQGSTMPLEEPPATPSEKPSAPTPPKEKKDAAVGDTVVGAASAALQPSEQILSGDKSSPDKSLPQTPVQTYTAAPWATWRPCDPAAPVRQPSTQSKAKTPGQWSLAWQQSQRQSWSSREHRQSSPGHSRSPSRETSWTGPTSPHGALRAVPCEQFAFGPTSPLQSPRAPPSPGLWGRGADARSDRGASSPGRDLAMLACYSPKQAPYYAASTARAAAATRSPTGSPVRQDGSTTGRSVPTPSFTYTPVDIARAAAITMEGSRTAQTFAQQILESLQLDNKKVEQARPSIPCHLQVATNRLYQLKLPPGVQRQFQGATLPPYYDTH